MTQNSTHTDSADAVDLVIDAPETDDAQTGFDALGLAPIILKTLHGFGYDTPTPIQEQAIPLVLAGHDIMGLAQTGTGKTAAFGLPLAHHLLGMGTKPKSKEVRALILAPTRELVNQIAVNLRDYVRRTHLKVTSVVGGQSIKVQMRNCERGSDILVATPGRLLDLLQRRALFLNETKFLVLDEADQMLDLGFINDLKKIAKLLPTPRQTLLFSATMPKTIADLSRTYLTNPKRVEVSPAGKAADKVTQCVHFVSQGGKTALLKECLIERRDDVSLIFARTKHGAEKLKNHLVECGHKAASIHGNKSQGQRDRAIRGFRNGDIQILVATDVAARGIDIPGVTHVYNYDLPDVPENYIHRIGRTARAGRAGQAIAFCNETEVHLLRAIEKIMGLGIPVKSGEPPADEVAAALLARKARSSNQRGGRGRPQGGGRPGGGGGGGKPGGGKPGKSRNQRNKKQTSYDPSGQPSGRPKNRGSKPRRSGGGGGRNSGSSR